jgi:hypothetical protein
MLVGAAEGDNVVGTPDGEELGTGEQTIQHAFGLDCGAGQMISPVSPTAASSPGQQVKSLNVGRSVGACVVGNRVGLPDVGLGVAGTGVGIVAVINVEGFIVAGTGVGLVVVGPSAGFVEAWPVEGTMLEGFAVDGTMVLSKQTRQHVKPGGHTEATSNTPPSGPSRGQHGSVGAMVRSLLLGVDGTLVGKNGILFALSEDSIDGAQVGAGVGSSVGGGVGEEVTASKFVSRDTGLYSYWTVTDPSDEVE